MHSIDKQQRAVHGDDAGPDASKPSGPTAHEVRLLVSGLPGTETQATQAINAILDRLDADTDLGDQLARYTYELTPPEERAFFTMARRQLRLRAGYGR